MNKNFFGSFFRNPKRNWIRIDRVLKSRYSVLCDYAKEKGIEDDEVLQKVVNNAFAEAYAEESKFKDDTDVLRYLFEKIDSGAATYFIQQQQLEKVSELLYGSDETKANGRENQKITLDVLEAFREEMEKLPRQRRLVISLFFCGLTSSEVAETVGREIQTVINQKNNAIKDIRKALVSRGYLSTGG